MFDRLSDIIGPFPALTFCAFASSRKTFYIPESYVQGHIIERVLGETAFLSLIKNFGGEIINVPTMRLDNVRTVGTVYALTRRGMNAQAIEQETGLGYRNVKRLQQLIASGGALSELGKSECHDS